MLKKVLYAFSSVVSTVVDPLSQYLRRPDATLDGAQRILQSQSAVLPPEILFITYKSRHNAILKYFIENNKLDVNAVCNDGHEDVPFFWVACCDDAEQIDYFIEHGANLKLQNNKKTFAHYACKHGAISVLEGLIKNGIDINENVENDATIVHYACLYAKLEVLKYLIERGYDINASDQHGNRPIHYAACANQRDVIEYLVEMKADIEAKNDLACTMVHLVCMNNSMSLLKYLIDLGVTIDDSHLEILSHISDYTNDYLPFIPLMNTLIINGANPYILPDHLLGLIIPPNVNPFLFKNIENNNKIAIEQYLSRDNPIIYKSSWGFWANAPLYALYKSITTNSDIINIFMQNGTISWDQLLQHSLNVFQNSSIQIKCVQYILTHADHLNIDQNVIDDILAENAISPYAEVMLRLEDLIHNFSTYTQRDTLEDKICIINDKLSGIAQQTQNNCIDQIWFDTLINTFNAIAEQHYSCQYSYHETEINDNNNTEIGIEMHHIHH
jgi:ankyrin repeat protein